MTRAADDFTAIAERLKEIEAAKGPPLACRGCNGAGWERLGEAWIMGVFVPARWATCHICGNPSSKPAP